MMRNKYILYVGFLAIFSVFTSMPMTAKAGEKRIDGKWINVRPPRRSPSMPIADVSYIKEEGMVCVTYNVPLPEVDVYIYQDDTMVSHIQEMDVVPGSTSVLSLDNIEDGSVYRMEIVIDGVTALVGNLW